MTRERRQRTKAAKAAWVALLALVASGSILAVVLMALTGTPSAQGGGSALGGTGSTTTSGSNGNTDPATGCNSNGSCTGHDDTFGVSVGDVRGLYPGRTTTVAVTYTNPNSFAIHVTGATLSASLLSSSAGTPACSAADLVTGTYPAPALLVAKNGSTVTSLPIGLRPTAPDACKRARWSITVTAQAVK